MRAFEIRLNYEAKAIQKTKEKNIYIINFSLYKNNLEIAELSIDVESHKITIHAEKEAEMSAFFLEINPNWQALQEKDKTELFYDISNILIEEAQIRQYLTRENKGAKLIYQIDGDLPNQYRIWEVPTNDRNREVVKSKYEKVIFYT